MDREGAGEGRPALLPFLARAGWNSTWLNADMPLLPQVLDEALLRRLCLTPAQAAQLPLHLHLRCLHLPGMRPREAPMKLLAPLPPYFSRTLQCLGLRQQ